MKLDSWYLDNLVCPRHRLSLRWDDPRLVCAQGDSYAVVDGVPVLLVDDVAQTHEAAAKSLNRGNGGNGDISALDQPQGLHPFVQQNLLATHGLMYRSVKLTEYPIPQIRLPAASHDELLLDIGCNWGRWCVAAARKGYQAVGIDPSLEAVLAARLVAKQVGANSRFVVGDARFLPFRDDLFDVVFSYSVLQHFSKQNVRMALNSIQQVLKADGVVEVQMLNSLGLRSVYNRARQQFAQPHEFDVRYWSPQELRDSFSDAIGHTRVVVDGFFTANGQRTDLHMLPARYRIVVQLSDMLRGLTRHVPLLANVADSLYVVSSGNPARVAEVERPLNET